MCACSVDWIILLIGYYLFNIRTKPFEIGSRVITRRELQMAFFSVALFTFLILGGLSSLVAIILSITCIFAHATFRKRSMKSRVDTFFRDGPGPLKGLGEDSTGDESDPDIENPSEVDQKKIREEQARFRSEFRATMRAKYLPNAPR